MKSANRRPLCPVEGRWAGWVTTALLAAGLGCNAVLASTSGAANRQLSLDEWRALTGPSNTPPRVFVKGDNLRFYFQTTNDMQGFSADWSRVRVPGHDYKVNSAVLRWDPALPKKLTDQHGWHEVRVIPRPAWREFATNLIAILAPPTPGHGAYYQAFLADGLLYRDTNGLPRFSALSDQAAHVVIDRRYSTEETLELLASRIEAMLHERFPGETLFLFMAPNAGRIAHPLLLDRGKRRCVLLWPAALYDPTESGLGWSGTAQGAEALLLEGHGLALLKNPVSSALRLADLGIQTAVRFLRLPLPRGSTPLPPPGQNARMNLREWEHWLDQYTGTRQEDGSLKLLIDGDAFFPRLRESFAKATNSIHADVYIFDRDDVGIGIADQLRARAREVEVKVILDRLGSIGGGLSPPSTPLPADFFMPRAILPYLRRDSRINVHPWLNPWFSSDHQKVFLVDHNRAWLGGMNLGREYRYEWHDLMLEVDGPVVATLERNFDRAWAHEGPWGDLGYTAALLRGPITAPPAGPQDSARMRLLPTRTLWKPFETAVLASLRKARNYVYVENPYLFDKRVLASLVHARRRGVDVRVVIPRSNDFKAGGRSNLIAANYLFQQGVRVYFYPGMTHVKALLVDDWACLGSANLNHMSMRLCQEQNIGTSAPQFTAELKAKLFKVDFERSYEMDEYISVDWVDFLSDVILENF